MGKIQYFPTVPSTNDIAIEWANRGAPDFSIVIADEQTAGRGRSGRKWFTPPRTSLAMSLVITPSPEETEILLSRLTGIGALGVIAALEKLRFNLKPQIKWPNDVLLDHQKISGILVESQWLGETLKALIIGIGVNILQGSTPPRDLVSYPAASIEDITGNRIDRWDFLKNILQGLIYWRKNYHSPKFIETWESYLAYRGKQVRIIQKSGNRTVGKIIGLTDEGYLRLLLPGGSESIFQSGEVTLRPVDSK